MIHGAHIYQMAKKESYDVSNHIKVKKKERYVLTMSSINYLHGRFSILSVVRSLCKLKMFNCFHRHRSELSVHKGTMIKVIIPENCFIIFHCGTPS